MMTETTTTSSSSSSSSVADCCRIVTPDEFESMKKEPKLYKGNALDEKDGYMHLSPWNEVRGTLERYFRGKQVVLLRINLQHPDIQSHVKWETVAERNNVAFPHLYDVALPYEAVTQFAFRTIPASGDLPAHTESVEQ